MNGYQVQMARWLDHKFFASIFKQNHLAVCPSQLGCFTNLPYVYQSSHTTLSLSSFIPSTLILVFLYPMVFTVSASSSILQMGHSELKIQKAILKTPMPLLTQTFCFSTLHPLCLQVPQRLSPVRTTRCRLLSSYGPRLENMRFQRFRLEKFLPAQPIGPFYSSNSSQLSTPLYCELLSAFYPIMALKSTIIIELYSRIINIQMDSNLSLSWLNQQQLLSIPIILSLLQRWCIVYDIYHLDCQRQGLGSLYL